MIIANAAVLSLLLTVAPAQWLNYPTPGVPRLPDGKPNLAATAPRTSDGKPDLSGLWEALKDGGSAPVAGGAELAPEFENIAARRKDPPPHRPLGLEPRGAPEGDNGKGHPDARVQPRRAVRLRTHP